MFYTEDVKKLSLKFRLIMKLRLGAITLELFNYVSFDIDLCYY